MGNHHLLHWLRVQRNTLKSWHLFSGRESLMHVKHGYLPPLQEQLGRNIERAKYAAQRRVNAKRPLKGHQLKRRVLRVRHGVPGW